MHTNEFLFEIPKTEDNRGNLSYLDTKLVPFEIKRVYYLYDIPIESVRGGHSHVEMQQVLIALSGSFNVNIFDGDKWSTYTLNKPYEGLYIPANKWRELERFSSGSICLSIVSNEYAESDYIRSMEEYLKLCKK